MNAVRLTVLTGPHKNRSFCFCGPTHCLVGRALDCFVQLSGEERDRLISRHHCEMDIDPPVVRLRDVGSANGTYLNGKKVQPNPASGVEPCSSVVENGDLVTVGDTTFRIELVDCPLAKRDGTGADLARKMRDVRSNDCPLPC